MESRQALGSTVKKARNNEDGALLEQHSGSEIKAVAGRFHPKWLGRDKFT